MTTSHPPQPSLRTAQPSEWPELLSAEAIGEILGKSTRTAQRLIREGVCGPHLEFGRTRYVRRLEFLKALKTKEQTPHRPPTPQPRPLVIPKRGVQSLK